MDGLPKEKSMTVEADTKTSTTQVVTQNETQGEATTSQAKVPAGMENDKAYQELFVKFNQAVESRDKAKEKLRKIEQEAGEKINTAFGKIKQSNIANSIEKHISELNPTDGAAISKLIDRSKITVSDDDFSVNAESVKKELERIQKEHPTLFDVPSKKSIPVQRAAESESADTFKQQVRNAKTFKELEQLRSSYLAGQKK